MTKGWLSNNHIRIIKDIQKYRKQPFSYTLYLILWLLIIFCVFFFTKILIIILLRSDAYL